MGLPDRAVAPEGPVPVPELREIAGRVAPVALAGEQQLPLRAGLEGLVPGKGLRRGSVIGVTGSMALALALLAGPSQAGSWVAVVGVPELGGVAAAELGVDLGRCALVPDPGPTWPTVVAALLDAIDVVAVGTGPGGGGGGVGRVRPADARRLAARARERGSVLVVVGAWPEGPDIRLSVPEVEWTGLEAGHGALRTRRLSVVGSGRGAAARERRAVVELP
ncbi:MAG TPA: hypothetical protein VM933_05165 [Acidimicrobiales bacterium]|nr:hypothetical protein [Acidimicrobiales bacterium]